ncbi:hypothetical protein ACFY1L_27450 [Streptomyces sp. NPDC001663]|uniref:hypothetical protein n=1 Tax=Streptomyces sp. NPDC001663 TaxID=3364597 RepID=UPI0036C403F9
MCGARDTEAFAGEGEIVQLATKYKSRSPVNASTMPVRHEAINGMVATAEHR